MTSRYLRLAADFDAAFARRATALTIRPEHESDLAFLTALFVACSPLAGILPQGMLEQQAELQQRAHRHERPLAMHRIIESAGLPVARAMIDWSGDSAYFIDLAVLPDARHTRAGGKLLLTWIEVADAVGLPCRLDVVQSNPAQAIYRKMGFVEIPGQSPHTPSLEMIREVPIGRG